jgi:hypothetical protein
LQPRLIENLKQFRAILAQKRLKRAFQSIGPLTLMLIRLFSLDLIFNQAISHKAQEKPLFPGNFQEMGLASH